MTVRAHWKGMLLAESDRTVLVEGNQYFPPEDVSSDLLHPSNTHSHCPWKGDASYYSVVVGDDRNDDSAWFYPDPYEAAAGIKDYVAFWRGVAITGANQGTPEIHPPGR